MSKNWMVVVKTKDGTLVKGIYKTKRAAQFISKRVKILEKLSYFPQVVETLSDIYPIDNKVEEYLLYLDTRKNDIPLSKKVIKYMPKVKN